MVKLVFHLELNDLLVLRQFFSLSKTGIIYLYTNALKRSEMYEIKNSFFLSEIKPVSYVFYSCFISSAVPMKEIMYSFGTDPFKFYVSF